MSFVMGIIEINVRRLCGGVANMTHLRRSRELGQATTEYGVVMLIAAALGLAVFMIFTGGSMDKTLEGMLKAVLNVATKMINR